MLSIVDARVQNYVRHRHYKVFNNSSNTNSPVHTSTAVLNLSTSTPNQSPNHQRSKRLINTTNTMYER